MAIRLHFCLTANNNFGSNYSRCRDFHPASTGILDQSTPWQIPLKLVYFWVLSLCVYAAVTLTISPPASAQNADLSETSNAALIEDLTEAADLFNTMWAERAETLAGAREVQANLDHSAVVIQSAALPEPPDMSEPPADLPATEQLAALWADRLSAATTLSGALEHRSEALSAYRDLSLRIAHETDTAAEAMARLRRLGAQARSRLSQGEVGLADSVAMADAAEDTITDEALAHELERWRGRARRADLERASVAARQAALATDTAGDEAARQTVNRWLQEATAQASFAERMANEPLGELIADVQDRLGGFAQAYAALRRDLFAARTLTRALERTRAELTALVPPEPANAAEGGGLGGTAALARAERAFAFAQSNATYRDDRLVLLRALRTAERDALQMTERIAGQIEPLTVTGLELDVMVRLLAERAPDTLARLDLTAESFAARFEFLREARAETATTQADLTAATEAMSDTMSTALAEQRRAREAVRASRSDLSREQAWAKFADELRDLSDEDLMTAFADADAQFTTQRIGLTAVERTIRRIESELAEIEAQARTSPDPAMAAVRADTERFGDWLAERNLRLPQPESADAPAATSTAGAPESAETNRSDTPADPASDTPATVRQVQSWLETARELRETLIVRRISFYRERAQNNQTLLAFYNDAQARLEEPAAAVDGAFDVARRAWAAANILTQRARAQSLPDDALPANLGRWSNRERQAEISDLARQVADLRASFADRIAVLEAAVSFQPVTQSLEDWRASIDLLIEKLGDLTQNAVQYEIVTDIDALPPFEKRRFESEVETRMENDFGVYNALDDFFASEETSSIDELLRRYYERLVISERRIENIETQDALVNALVTETQATRPQLEALLSAVDAVATEFAIRAEIAARLTRAALEPSASTEILADLVERYPEREITADDIVPLPAGLEGEDLDAARVTRIEALADIWAAADGYRAWHRALEVELGPLGRIDTSVNAFEALSASLHSRRDDITRNVERLTGLSDAALAGLTAEAPEARRQRLGEIGALQAERRERITENATISLASLVIIPIAAFTIIIVARLLGRIAIRRTSRSKVEKSGAVERVTTLNGIAQSALTIVIFALSVVYMLKAVNVDVTPILASLGIFGLAVAFGAQGLMKDVFSGLFLLMENQINKDDWIKINGVVGFVEGIGLRITKVREYSTGLLHYIPNGQVTSVASYNRGYLTILMNFNFPFGADLHRIATLMDEVIASIKTDPEFAREIVQLHRVDGVTGIDDKAMGWTITVQADLNSTPASSVPDAFRSRLSHRLREDGITMAMPITVQLNEADMRRASLTPDPSASLHPRWV